MISKVRRDIPTADELARMALDNVSAMVAYWDADQICRFANRAYEHWFAVNPQTIIGKHISELLGPLYALNRPYIEAALCGEPQEFEREIPNPAAGPARPALANYIPDVVDGVVRGFFVLVTDISAVKRTETALRESEERFRLTLEEAPIGMAVVGTDGRFLRVNGALCAILGYSAQELVGMTFQSVTHPEDLDADLALARQLARGEIPRYSLERRYVRKDGHVVDIELSRSVLRGPDGQPLHFIAQVKDISERKRRGREQQFLADLGPVLASTLDSRLSSSASLSWSRARSPTSASSTSSTTARWCARLSQAGIRRSVLSLRLCGTCRWTGTSPRCCPKRAARAGRCWCSAWTTRRSR